MSKLNKGMVLEIQDQMATVLTSDGQFVKTKIPKNGCHIGDEIAFETSPEQTSILRRLLSRLQQNSLSNAGYHPRLGMQLAALGLTVLAGGVSWAYPAGHVYMDVNPSLGITYNIYHRVISVESFNEDGRVIKSGLSSYGKSLEETIESTLLLMNEKGFVKDDSSAVILGFSEENGAVKAEAVKAVGTAVDKAQKVIEVASVQVAKAETAQAKDLGSSPIKVAIVTEQLTENATAEEVKTKVETLETKTTKEIIQENKAVQKVIDERLVQIQKAIELKKQKIQELERLKQNQQKKQQQQKQQNQNQNQNQDQNQNQNQNQDQNQTSVDVSAQAQPKDAAAALAAQKQKLETLKKAQAELKAKANQLAKNSPNSEGSTSAGPGTDETNAETSVDGANSSGEASDVTEDSTVTVDSVEGADLSKLEKIPGETIKEKVQNLEQMRKNLIEVRAKLIKSKLAPAEKNKRINQINKQLERINGLLEEIKEKAKKVKEQKETSNKKP